MVGILNSISSYVSQSPLRQLGYSAITAASVSMVAKAVGFGKEVVVAAKFGISGGIDVYLMAFVLIGFPLGIFLNAVQSVLISRLAASASNAPGEARLYSSTVVLTLALLAVALPVWLVVLHYLLPWLASGFSDEKLEWLFSAIYWLIPYYFLNGFNLLAYGALQAKKRFVLNGLLPTITPVATIAVVMVFSQSMHWQVLVMALIVGATLEFLVLNLYHYFHGEYARPQIIGNADIKIIVNGSLTLLSGTSIMAMSPLIEQSIAASLGEGTNAALGYGFRLPAAINGLLVTAIGITALPYFAKLLTEEKMSYCLHSLEKLSRWLLMLGLPFAIMLALFSDTIVSLLFQRGAFDAASVERVSPIQQAYFLQLPFALVVMLTTRVLIAMNQHGVVSILFAGTVLIQGLMAWWLGITLGAHGIAWGITITTIIASIATFHLSRSFLLKKIA